MAPPCVEPGEPWTSGGKRGSVNGKPELLRPEILLEIELKVTVKMIDVPSEGNCGRRKGLQEIRQKVTV